MLGTGFRVWLKIRRDSRATTTIASVCPNSNSGLYGLIHRYIVFRTIGVSGDFIGVISWVESKAFAVGLQGELLCTYPQTLEVKGARIQT